MFLTKSIQHVNPHFFARRWKAGQFTKRCVMLRMLAVGNVQKFYNNFCKTRGMNSKGNYKYRGDVGSVYLLTAKLGLLIPRN